MPKWEVWLDGIPPSANKIWETKIHCKKRIVKGMVQKKHFAKVTLSQPYDLWLEVNMRKIWQENTTRKFPADLVEIRIWLYGGKGWTKSRDPDNIVKPCVDLITKAGLIDDDNCTIVQRVIVTYVPAPSKKCVAHCVIQLSDYVQEEAWTPSRSA